MTWKAIGIGLLALSLQGQTPETSAPSPVQPLEAGSLVSAESWLSEVALLVTESERAAQLATSDAAELDALREQFWTRRDPTPHTPENEFRQRWAERVREARAWAARAGASDLSDVRAETILMLGPPRRVFDLPCTQPWGEFPIQPLEVWYYPSRRYRGPGAEPFYLVFLRPDPLHTGTVRVRQWAPDQGLRGLLFEHYRERFDTAYISLRKIAESVDRGLCYRRHRPEFEALERATRGAFGRAEVEELAALPRPAANSPLPQPAEEAIPGTLRWEVAGQRDDRTVIEGRFALDARLLAELPGQDPLHHLLWSGTLRRDTAGGDRGLHEHFLYRAYVSRSDETARPRLDFRFYRTLAPGRYTLDLTLTDDESRRRFRSRYPLTVPELGDEGAPHRLASTAEPTRHLLVEGRPALVMRRTSLEILPPPPGLHLGPLELSAVITGPEIARLSWTLNGAQVEAEDTAPFGISVDLGSTPRTHRVEATAWSAHGEPLAQDRIEINAGPHRLRVRLVEPLAGGTYPLTAPTRAAVELPEGAELDRVDFFLDDTLVGSSRTPPFLLDIPVPRPEVLSMVRAVAHLTDGRRADHGVLINTREILEEVNVDFVELFLTARDPADRPVLDLAAEEVSIREDGIDQTISRFERVENLPLHAAVLMDVSESMGQRLGRASAAARQFFETVVTDKDRASLLTFNHTLHLVVPFTHRVDQLRAGLRGLDSAGSTALFDSLADSLYYFGGLDGQRALILLTDSAAENSLLRFASVLEYARRAGVAVYPIAFRSRALPGTALHRRSTELLAQLETLAGQTGGQAWAIDSPEELDAIYSRIESELRSQYLVAYQSSQGSSGPDFRSIRVTIGRSGVSSHTISGYYAR